MRHAIASLAFVALPSLLVIVGCSPETASSTMMAMPDLGPPPPDMARPPVCEPLKMAARPFDAKGPYGKLRDSLVADFTVTDQTGAWSLKAEWSGCESYVFIPDTIVVSSKDPASIWTADLDDLLRRSPPNVHYFFVSRKSDAAASLKLIADQLDGVIGALPEGDGPGQRLWWRSRLHLVQGSGKAIEGWVGELLTMTPSLSTVGAGFAIDRFQRLRALGNLGDVGRNNGASWPDNNMGYAAHPALYFNYEAERQAKIDGEKSPTVVTAINREMLKLVDERDVVFPDAAAMKGFDTLEVDLTMDCQSRAKFEEWQDDPALDPIHYNCGPWDYIASIEVQDDKDAMKYHEVARFISTYHRAGRYFVDASHALPMLAGGGKHHVRYNLASPPWNQQTYDTVMVFRFTNKAGAARPTQSTFLFSGGAFGDTYNAKYMPVSVPIPPTAKKVELHAIITGHGSATSQCSEFCNHQHEFTVNGMKFRKEFSDTIGDQEGCVRQIAQGAVPNQSGTWWYGRGGWCPGMQVDPWVVDVTAAVSAGQTATVTYQGMYANRPVTGKRGDIDMTSWLVVYE